MFRWSVAVIVLFMAINAYNLGGSAARPAPPDWARDKYGNVTMAPASYYATADDARVNVARQNTGLMSADNGYGINVRGRQLRTSGLEPAAPVCRKDRPAVPSAGSHDQLSLAAIKRDKGYAHKRYDDTSGKPSRYYNKPRKRGKRGSGKGGQI